ncbi:hypothetical protein PN462_07495 [Spirulina sp. CS-785/01]|uniref:hypothetical protein n=1 Tax=Spirulina sp. CS-785/01 TaxID=3021716 RepID=UPI002330AAD6|nr:hypothetical protein [Spirulina sp. CS-785/01]MDB9312940.1 hypothetical protein [Spirulina sp. CS-785/01]
MQKRCVRNRKRSKRRAIYCPYHGCYLDSVSKKYSLYTESAGQLRSRGINRLAALLLVATRTAVPLVGEWLEAFWCPECEETRWYHVHKVGDREYKITPAPPELWKQASGVTDPHGNPSVGEFTRRESRNKGKKQFGRN